MIEILKCRSLHIPLLVLVMLSRAITTPVVGVHISNTFRVKVSDINPTFQEMQRVLSFGTKSYELAIVSFKIKIVI
jgi:3-dehydroquinate dehydratase